MPIQLQKNRFLQIETPLAKDELLAIDFTADEHVSREFRFSLDLISSNIDIDPKQLLKKPMTVSINASKTGEQRYFHGLVSYFEGGLIEKKMRYYRAELRPWLWFLNHTVDCHIFQNKNTLGIIKAIFEKQNTLDYDMQYIDQASYPIRDYCFQYGESDFQFVQRLLSEEGIFYYFTHQKDKHILVFGDANRAFKPINPKMVEFSSGSSKGYYIKHWSRGHHFYAGKAVQNEYDFKQPNTSLIAQPTSHAKLPKACDHEIYHYPINHENHTTGSQRTQRQLESQELKFQIRHGAGNYEQFSAGGRFNFPSPPTPSEAGDYLIANVIHHAADNTYLNGPTGGQSYRNTFVAIPDTLNFRMPMHIQRPVIASAQTAIVVGPKGEEIYTDMHGRVKVQFHWDRKSAKDEHSSCWIRVAQLWAGNGWGTQFIPRIGQEVIVQFLEGNPDRPIITGCVYNANNPGPYSLPAQKTQSGIKSRSTKGGGSDDYNELRFEDKLGQEELLIRAQKNLTEQVKNDVSLTVGNNATQTISNNLTIHIGNTGLLEAAQSLTLKVGSNCILIDAQGVSIHGAQVKINT